MNVTFHKRSDKMKKNTNRDSSYESKEGLSQNTNTKDKSNSVISNGIMILLDKLLEIFDTGEEVHPPTQSTRDLEVLLVGDVIVDSSEEY